MNTFLRRSIELANQRNYLDKLYAVYPSSVNAVRCLDSTKWGRVEGAYKNRDRANLITSLLELDLFPIKDSYIAYLRRDRSSIERNPRTIRRLSSYLFDMGIDEIYEKCSQPKEANRQIGPMFKSWVAQGNLEFPLMNLHEFTNSDMAKDSILCGSDKEMKDFASEVLDYKRDKGLDFVARVNGKYLIAEAKFLTDYGGHQDAQLLDALSTLDEKVGNNVLTAAILDGVCFIESGNKMYSTITSERYKNKNIFSALYLRDFLYTL